VKIKVIKKNISILPKEKEVNKPLKFLKKIDINKFKKITSFSLNKTFDNFKQKIKQAAIKKIKF